MKVKACQSESHSGRAEDRLRHALAEIRARRIRITTPRRKILRVLAKSLRPLSSDEVFSQLEKGSDLVTVYRSLGTLEQAGLLRRYDLGDGVRRYELSSEGHHHHYVRCRGCGTVEAFEGCDFEEKLSRILARKGYRGIQHSLDVQALCPHCQTKKET